MRKSSKVVFIVLLILVFSSASWALEPDNALSARPAKSFYVTMRIDDLNGLLQSIFSPENIEALASMGRPEDAQGVRLTASLASQIPAKSVALAFGMEQGMFTPFMQVAASMPAAARSKLNNVAQGKASGMELITLLAGDAALIFASGFEPVLQQGAKGPYYTLGPISVAAKEDLLLVALSPAELEASLNALDKKENRLAFKRRFKSPNYYTFHMDVSMIAELSQATHSKGGVNPADITSFFKAPLEMEMAFESKPGNFLVSAGLNTLEAYAIADRFKDVKPTSGAGLFLAGEGRALLAYGSPLLLRASDWKINPKFAESWNNIVKELEKRGITERDVENLLGGRISLVWGSDATILGRKMPGGYLAFTGQKGAAANILKKIVDDEDISSALPLSPVKLGGWDLLYTVDPAMVPVPLVVGVSGDTLFLGVADTNGLGKKPGLPPEGEKLLKENLVGAGFFDTTAIWNFLRKEAADPSSPFTATLDDNVKLVVKDVLEADLSIPFVKVWTPDLETGFMEFTIVDVPQGKRLLPRLLKVATMVQSTFEEDNEDDDD